MPNAASARRATAFRSATDTFGTTATKAPSATGSGSGARRNARLGDPADRTARHAVRRLAFRLDDQESRTALRSPGRSEDRARPAQLQALQAARGVRNRRQPLLRRPHGAARRETARRLRFPQELLLLLRRQRPQLEGQPLLGIRPRGVHHRRRQAHLLLRGTGFGTEEARKDAGKRWSDSPSEPSPPAKRASRPRFPGGGMPETKAPHVRIQPIRRTLRAPSARRHSSRPAGTRRKGAPPDTGR